MSGLDTDIVVHRLQTREDYPLVKQNDHRMHPEMSEKIKAEVMKQFNAGFLVVTSYPQWITNVVPMPKKDGKVRMCMDYRDLNRASPKDDFPLPHIDVLVNNTTQHITKSSPSWMDFMATTRSRWLLKTWRRQPSLQSRAPSVTR